MAKGLIVAGDDPDYAKKVRKDAKHVLVWGGSPTGSWAAEYSHGHGADDVTVLGDLRDGADWPTVFREYSAVTSQLSDLPDAGGDVVAARTLLNRRKEALEALIRRAHGGSAVPRNVKPGAAYNNPDIHVEFGTPSKIEELPDGRVAVTIGTGEGARTAAFDQIVAAHGQDPGAAGGPGELLGAPAAKAADGSLGEVPEGTIALTPIYSARRDERGEVVKDAAGRPVHDLVGLESVEPRGLRLIGAAYASKKLAPWVRGADREAFVNKLDETAVEDALTRDHGRISEDSAGVTTGIEAQRDAIPRANEVLAAQAYRLPGPDRVLELDPARPADWDAEVRTFLAASMRAEDKWVRVERLGGGATKAVVYRVWIAEHEVGVLKLFDRVGAAEAERDMLKLLDEAKLTKIKAVRERGVVGIDEASGYGGALLMDSAKGTSIKDIVGGLPDDPVARLDDFKMLQAAVSRTATGLAEMHRHFAAGEMTSEAKLSDANYFLERNFRGGVEAEKVRIALGDEFASVKASLEGPMLSTFLAAEVPATAYHGDANVGNFIVDRYDAHRRTFEDLGVIDVGNMKWSMPDGAAKGTKTGAADMARLLGSLESMFPGKLTPAEIATLSDAFSAAYFAGSSIDRAGFEDAALWYRVEMEVAALKSGDQTARGRILNALGLEGAP